MSPPAQDPDKFSIGSPPASSKPKVAEGAPVARGGKEANMKDEHKQLHSHDAPALKAESNNELALLHQNKTQQQLLKMGSASEPSETARTVSAAGQPSATAAIDSNVGVSGSSRPSGLAAGVTVAHPFHPSHPSSTLPTNQQESLQTHNDTLTVLLQDFLQNKDAKT